MTTHIAHLNCATMRPVGSFGGRGLPSDMVAHCLLVERPEGLLLVDTGFGTADLADPRRLGRPFVTMVRPSFDPAETARAQVEARGFTCDDVTDIALTHLDLDHAGGLSDFPRARVHVFADELDAARNPKLNERARYVAGQWAHHPTWVEHRPSGEEWFGFTAVQALGDDVVLVPLTGHTRGHCGVAVRRPGGGWLLHAGDSYFYAGETLTPPTYQRGLTVFQTLMAANNGQRRANQERLRTLRADHGDEVLVFSAHDRSEYAALAAAESH
ncbi:MBL fold metallo-hydrolase [Nocardioides sp.]|uniref:MBL fold metallo-hydrolase n=1 Tax=Nocardioides sp. TaxID=35761 RepID=UPI002733F6BE|nr:MBL fold metallo-hydrolase [Nocardioides sp.]MDP3891206.1 MBL fold metallo-hydrolase [Nocardioides sp.]